jgi:outer membrane receptor protein involved in Fe transport
MTAADAVRRLARQAEAMVVPVGTVGWRLARRPASFASAKPRRIAPVRPRQDPAATEVVVIGSKRGAARWNLATAVERLGAPDQAIVAGSQAIVLASTVVSSTYRGPGRDKLFVRGIADSAFLGQTQAVTGLYLGDLRLGYGSADPDLLLHDMESVEVIQGAQGSLYGSGSLAGVIRLNPRRPRLNRLEGAAGGGVALTAQGAPSVDSDVMLNLPLGDRTAVRLVAYARQDGGYVDKPAVGRDVNRVRIAGGRIDLRRSLGADWTIDAVLAAQGVRARDAFYVTRGMPGLTSDAAAAEPFSSDFGAAHLVATGRIGTLELTSSTGLSTQSLKERNDARLDATARSVVDSARRDDLLLHETRIASPGSDGRGWVAGLSLTRSSQTLNRRIILSDAQVLARIDNRITEAALYGDGSLRPWRPLLLGGGLRVALIRSDARPEGNDPLRPGERQQVGRTQGWLVPSLSALLRVFDGASLFTRYQQGFRPGVLVPAQGQTVDRLERDELRSFEGGARFNRDVFIAEVSAVRSYWKNIQGDYSDGDGPPFAANLGNGRIVSVSARATWQATPAFSVDAAVTLNRSKLEPPRSDTIPVAPPLDPEQPITAASSVAFDRLDRIPYVADMIARAGGQYRRELGGGARLDLTGWVRHEGRSAGAFGPIRTAMQGPVWLSGASATLSRGDTEMRLSVDNLLDTRGARFISGPSVGTGDLFAAPPRPFTARIGMRRAF